MACEVHSGGTVSDILAQRVHIKTSGDVADAGIGAGRVFPDGTVNSTTAVDSSVETSGNFANAGIGAGFVKPNGTVNSTTAVDSWVEASGKYAKAGIGAGIVNSGGTVTSTMAVNCTVDKVINNQGDISQLPPLCQRADPRVLTADCHPKDAFLDILNGKAGGQSDVCARSSVTVSTATTTALTVGLVATGLAAAAYPVYHWVTGFREGLRGMALVKKPFISLKTQTGGVINSVYQRVNRERVPTEEPGHEMSEVPAQSERV